MKRKRKNIPLAWLQLIHSKVRFVVALAGIAFAGILIFMQLGFQTSLYNSAVKVHQAIRADLVLISPKARNFNSMSTIPRRRLYQASSVPDVAAAESLYIENLLWSPPEARKRQSNLSVLGFDPVHSIFKLTAINQQLSKLKMQDYLLFDEGTKGSFPETLLRLEEGQTVISEMNQRRVSLVGLFRIGNSFGTDGYVITSDLNFLRLFSDRQKAKVSIGLITLKAGIQADIVKPMLQSYFDRGDRDVRVLTYPEWIEFEKSYWQRGSAIGFIFNLGVLMGCVVGVVIVYQILYSDVSDHLAEYATLKAMGYRHIYLLSLVFQESLILATLGYIPGFVISQLLYGIARQQTRLPILMDFHRATLVFILTIVMCLISGAIAVQKLKSVDPADVF
ncbi:MAG: ABC transporter permease DevC [Waterburya sp.]